MRTHSCGELRETHVGQPVTLCGWVHRRRDHGKLIFLDLRDRYGMTQVVVHAKESPAGYAQAQEVRNEYALRVRGTVRQRPDGTVNDELPTGRVEVGVSALDVLNAAETPPFEIEDRVTASEETRLTYRYLDLRRPPMQQRLALRHRACQITRQVLDARGFLEIETPCLTRSTPEGARDYLVPSRLHPGAWYALPQSPQLFKQLLMVGGCDRYYQIARCFRDEDLRADRQPEFTQIDLEMSFVEEEAIFEVTEELLVRLVGELANHTLTRPFRRIPYEQAMREYGTDKPDLRSDAGPFACVWVTDFPLFAFNAELKRWEAAHHPFTAPQAGHLALLERDPGQVRSRAYDLVVNGVEVGSGSIRIHQAELQRRVLRVLGFSDAEMDERFGFLIRALGYGAPPHGGIAPGLDRLVALLAGDDSIRDVIPFPKTQRAICPVTGAPAPVAAEQLRELGIRLAAGGDSV